MGNDNATKTTKAINVRLENDLHKQFKIYVTNKGTSMQEFIVELIKENMKTGEK